MDKLEKTKDNIGVSELDEETRKKLFNRFVDAGGEVLTSRQRRKNIIIDRNGQRRMQEKLNNIPRSDSEKKNKKTVRKKARFQNKKEKKGDSLSLASTFRFFKLRLRMKFLRVAQFNNLYFNLKFLEKFNNVYKPALMEMQIIYLNLFKKDLKTGNRIMARLDSLKPLYYELIEMIGNIYDKMAIDQVVDHYINFPDVPKKISELREPLMDIFAKLYILRMYENTIFEAVNKAVELNQTLLEKSDAVDSSTRKKARNDLFTIFHKLYPRLHWLFCHYNGIYLEYDDPAVEDFLDISENDRPGKRVIKRIFDNRIPYQAMEELSPYSDDEDSYVDGLDTSPTEEKDDVPEQVKEGLKLMYNLNVRDLRVKYDKQGVFEKVSDNDPILLSYLLFNEFDQEYSFILTTNKINFNTDYIRRGEYNYKTKLNDLYDDMRKPHDALKNYAVEFARYEKARTQRPVGNTQYIAYTKRLESINKKKNLAGRLARLSVNAYMNKVAEEMKILIDDMDGQQKLILNPQDVLEFNESFEGDIKINGMKVYEAVRATYDYASALTYRLSAAEGMEEAGQMADAVEENSPVSEEDALSESSSGSEDNSKRSIFDELDDML